ncbi:hypothetical protein [Aquisphaera giovannonii]|uniref:hypothetical protein n=1 Tax=Aquisphaera giovannonii TaxID=406548 RepID=UPI0011DF359E|nr:hypothetical protein [Aquisphaera giovannonii]
MEPIDDAEAERLLKQGAFAKDRPARPAADRKPRPDPAKPPGEPSPGTAEPPIRSGGLLGRFLAPPAGRERGRAAESSITVEPLSDPATETALKRRLEKQIQQELGDRVTSAEVRVAGRVVSIRVRVSRFWLRRGVRRSLESFHVPPGYRVRVDSVE